MLLAVLTQLDVLQAIPKYSIQEKTRCKIIFKEINLYSMSRRKQMNCTKCGEALKELITELKEKINL